MNLELYRPGQSVLHTLDPRVKVVGLTWFGLLVLISDWLGLIFLSLIFLILSGIGKIHLKEYLAVVVVTLWLSVFYGLASAWTWTDPVYFWRGYWSLEGLKTAGILVWKIALTFGLTRQFLLVTPALEQGIGIAYYINPLTKLTPKAADFALLLTLTLRFIPLLLEEAQKIWKARVAKGRLPRTLWGRIKEIANLFVPLILLGLRRAEEVANSLLARGYVSGKYRVASTKEWDSKDNWGVGFIVATSLVVITIKYI